jgi:hypothetical protein
LLVLKALGLDVTESAPGHSVIGLQFSLVALSRRGLPVPLEATSSGSWPLFFCP